MFCANCGSALEEVNSFCARCGRRVNSVAIDPAKFRRVRLFLIPVMILLFFAGTIILYQLHTDSPLCPTVDCPDTR